MYGSANEAAMNSIQQLAAQRQMGQLTQAISPQQEAASRWALTADRLERARHALDSAQSELQEAQAAERAAWNDLEALSGRSKAEAATYVKR